RQPRRGSAGCASNRIGVHVGRTPPTRACMASTLSQRQRKPTHARGWFDSAESLPREGLSLAPSWDLSIGVLPYPLSSVRLSQSPRVLPIPAHGPSPKHLSGN